MDSELVADCGNAHMCCSDVSDKSGGLGKDKFINIHEQNGSDKKKHKRYPREKATWMEFMLEKFPITIMKALSTKCKDAHPHSQEFCQGWERCRLQESYRVNHSSLGHVLHYYTT